jgi:hypothetical protein
MYVKFVFCLRSGVANEVLHRAIFLYMFAKQQQREQDDEE